MVNCSKIEQQNPLISLYSLKSLFFYWMLNKRVSRHTKNEVSSDERHRWPQFIFSLLSQLMKRRRNLRSRVRKIMFSEGIHKKKSKQSSCFFHVGFFKRLKDHVDRFIHYGHVCGFLDSCEFIPCVLLTMVWKLANFVTPAEIWGLLTTLAV